MAQEKRRRHRADFRRNFRGRCGRNRYAAETSEAVRLAPNSFVGKPVVWRLGCNESPSPCFEDGDLNKRVALTVDGDLNYDRHKGMSFLHVLGKIQHVDDSGVSLEVLRSR